MEWIILLIGLFVGYFFGLMSDIGRSRGSVQELWEYAMNHATRELKEGQTLCFHASVGKFQGDDDDGNGDAEPEPDPVLQNWRNN